MIELIPPPSPEEELKRQWAETIQPKINQVRKGNGFEKELENAKAKINEQRKKAMEEIYRTRYELDTPRTRVRLYSVSKAQS